MTTVKPTSQIRQRIIYVFIIVVLILIGLQVGAQSKKGKTVKYNKLTEEEARVIIHKGTEAPFSGEFNKHSEAGTYICRQCNAPLYRSTDKFNSHCGWPSYDDAIDGAVTQIPDADGRRTEIICSNCKGHLGHIFFGEQLTEKNTRHCVNSLSMKFVSSDTDKQKIGKAYFAGGCFWGVEYYLEQADGVISATSGYMGGNVDDPEYKEVCFGFTGHAEAVEVIFDKSKTDFETLARLFFEIHDPTQVERQGPDIGNQYRSAIFYVDENQKEISEKLIELLKDKGFDVATELTSADKFWKAEANHQDYYSRNGHEPYCHTRVKRF